MYLHRCSVCCPHEAPAGGGSRRRTFTVDLHCHAMTLAVEPLVADAPQKKAESGFMLKAMGEASIAHNNAVMLPHAFPRLTQVERRLQDMDTMGVEVQVISPSPAQYYYWAERDLAREITRMQNEHIAATCALYPKRLLGLGTVALQHPELAVEQLTHAVRRLGLKGVQISTSVNQRELDHESLEPFWAKAADLDAIVFIHPFGSTLGDRASTHYLSNIIGQPLETTIALSRLIFGGVLERHASLRIVAAHGGGYLPSYAGRSNHGHQVRPEARASAPRLPVEYLRRIWFDSLVYEPEALRHLVEIVGDTQVVIGTDYPFDMGHYDPHGLVETTPDLSDAQRAQILGGNAARLLGIAAVSPAR